MRRDPVDFFAVRSGHEAIHGLLVNWSRCVLGGRSLGTPPLPMFRLYRAPDTWVDPEPRIPIDSLAGWKMERHVGDLPDKHKGAIRWYYVDAECGVNPHHACRLLKVRIDRLSELVHDGRSMLRNRGA